MLKQDPDCLLFAVVSRLVWQKGLDLLATAVPTMIERGAQLAVLGAGDPELEQGVLGLAKSHPGQVGCVIGYDEGLAHLIHAGADAVLIPSRFEPCGLTQLCAMRYGAVPVASKVGGLADTIVDSGEAGEPGTGLHISPVSREGIEGTLRRTADDWSDRPRWHALQRNGMRTDVSWADPAQDYFKLYQSVLRAKK
jgi:starch synthase